jgi:hypothetical protein
VVFYRTSAHIYDSFHFLGVPSVPSFFICSPLEECMKLWHCSSCGPKFLHPPESCFLYSNTLLSILLWDYPSIMFTLYYYYYYYYYYYGFYSHLLGLGPFFSFLILYIVGRTPWTGDQPVARPLPMHRTPQTQNKHTIHTSMASVAFEPTIPAFERANTIYILDRPATVIGVHFIWVSKITASYTKPTLITTFHMD